MIKKVENTVPWTYVIGNLKDAENVQFRIEKVIRIKGGKLYVKWKGNENSLNSCIDKKMFLYKMRYFPEPYIYP